MGGAVQRTAPCAALHCITKPGTLVSRSAWEAVGGLDERLRIAIDYDLWWRLYKRFAPLEFVDEFVALNRDHVDTKTNTQRQLHYREAMEIVRRHDGRVPLKWWLARPYAVWWKSAKIHLANSELPTKGSSYRFAMPLGIFCFDGALVNQSTMCDDGRCFKTPLL